MPDFSERVGTVCSLIPRPPLFLLFQFVFNISMILSSFKSTVLLHKQSNWNLRLQSLFCLKNLVQVVHGLTVCRSLLKRMSVTNPTMMKMGSRLHQARSMPR